ncbi:5-formyltetrahydrofolate cyclo-ligase [Ostreibacterium oceani]|uniref:5-formyltetrahydrofolate cyclo-ligase n=1 Tax=Ostreibacterium oceani TaxID=2654998 RepID=A0A6N7ETF2_9GAMM|nr:5-formyltetrahydrofolate cyclo-ligase [Ostreibacterium oceani]MPV85213.1 5-formyltetrahydrofolate cyclo-ligase [Ostreibacterium oceani]
MEIQTQKTIRTNKRQARNNLPPAEKIAAADKICAQLIKLPAFVAAQQVACYLSMPEEVTVMPVIDACWALGKSVYLPVTMAWKTPLQFVKYVPDMPLTKDAIGMDIPDANPADYVLADDIDLIVTPLVAFDQSCNRIGMGGGFYDRTFAFKKRAPMVAPVLVGVAFDIQRTTQPIEVNEWDVSPDYIISEKAVYTSA